MRLHFVWAICLSLLLQKAAISQGSFKMFFEKTYVCTDRDYYAAGEDIWLKAYLVNAQTGLRTNTSANLYVELIAPDATIISKETLHLVNGQAKGDFTLPAAVPSGNFRIRAYTNWMKNFGDMFVFEKSITVAADAAVKTVKPKDEPVVAAVAVNTATIGVNHLYFFPEGGNMVAGLPAHIAFKATDAYGKGISAKGKIMTASGDSIAAFETLNAGMGHFTFTPQPGKTYLATGKYYGKEMFSEALPVPSADGFVLTLKEEPDAFAATIRAGSATLAALNHQPLSVIARHVGKKCFYDSLVMNKNEAVIRIPKDSLPPGLCSITLYDADSRPQCERLIFVGNPAPVQLSVSTSQPVYATRDSVMVNISVADARNRPVMATLCLAATDAGLIEAGQHTIASYLLLESEIKGEIENPAQYFDPANPQRLAQLDLLLQTQGWRSFLWRRLKDTSIVVKYLPEPGITLSGRVRRALINQGIGNMNITLFAGKSSGDKLFFTKTQPDGRFFLDGLPLTGPQTVKLVVRNEKNNKEGMILLDSVVGKPLPLQKTTNLVYDTSSVTASFWRNAANRNELMREQEKKAQADLGNVTVKADPIKREQLQERGMRFGDADSLFTIQPSDKEYETVAHFIVQRYPGAYTDAESSGFYFYGDGMTKILPRWIVDGKEDRFSTGSPFDVDDASQVINGSFERIDYYNIPITKVQKVYIQPLVSRTGSIVYVVHLSLLPGAFDASDLSQIITEINGYYEARRYYVPPFTPGANNTSRTDLRSTVFWAPDIKTDANGKATIRFRNTDAKTPIRICLQGITDSGEPVAAETKYEVK